MNRFDFVQTNALNFCCHSLSHQNSVCRILFKVSLHRHLYGPLKPKDGIGLFIPEKGTCFFQKPAAAFHSSSYQSTFLKHVKTKGVVSCCVCFLATELSFLQCAKNCLPVCFVLITTFNRFKKTGSICQIELPINKIATVGHLSIRFVNKRFFHWNLEGS